MPTRNNAGVEIKGERFLMGLGGQLIAGWSWWISTLGSMAPRSLVDWSSGLPQRMTGEISARAERPGSLGRRITLPFDGSLEASVGQLEALRRKLPRRALLDVVLPSEICLIRQHVIPKGAERRIDEILTLDLNRGTPLRPEAIVWKPVIGSKERDGIHVDQVILRRRDLALLQEAVEAQGFLLGRVSTEHPKTTQRVCLLDDSEARKAINGIWPRINQVLAVTLVALATLSVALPHLERRDRLADLKAETAALRTQTVALRAELDQQRAVHQANDSLIEGLSATLSNIDVLRELTTRLPDDTWLADMEIAGEALRFGGFTKGSAAELAIDLDASPLFSNPRLTGPVSIAPGTGAERFEISLDLRSAEP